MEITQPWDLGDPRGRLLPSSRTKTRCTAPPSTSGRRAPADHSLTLKAYPSRRALTLEASSKQVSVRPPAEWFTMSIVTLFQEFDQSGW